MATDAKLMLNTLWGEFGHPMNMTGTWQRRDTMRWQKTEAPLACREAAVDTQERLDPRVKCGLWRWAITRTGVSASDASYLDVLDEHIVTYIIQLASWGVVQDKKEMGWASLHAEYLLLPRCPVHDTVIIFYWFLLLMTRDHTWFFFPLDVMGVGKRPEKHLVSMSLSHSRIILGSVPILCPALHALSKSGSSL